MGLESGGYLRRRMAAGENFDLWTKFDSGWSPPNVNPRSDPPCQTVGGARFVVAAAAAGDPCIAVGSRAGDGMSGWWTLNFAPRFTGPRRPPGCRRLRSAGAGEHPRVKYHHLHTLLHTTHVAEIDSTTLYTAADCSVHDRQSASPIDLQTTTARDQRLV